MSRTILKIIFIGIIFLSFENESKAQNWEVGVLGGLSHYYGDVSNEFHVENMSYSSLLFVRKHVSQRVVIRGNLGYIRIIGIDSVSTSSFQKGRNLNFFTDIYELSGQVEYNFVDDKTRGRRIKNYTIPYAFIGLGGIYFNPQTVYNGATYSLPDYQTSGIKYSQFALVVPVGAGVRYYLTPNWQIGFEVGIRFTSTSDLDDIRGTSLFPDPASLPSNLSRELAVRTASPYASPKGGTDRGKIKYITDTYVAYGLTLSYKFGFVRGMRMKGQTLHCPRFY